MNLPAKCSVVVSGPKTAISKLSQIHAGEDRNLPTMSKRKSLGEPSTQRKRPKSLEGQTTPPFSSRTKSNHTPSRYVVESTQLSELPAEILVNIFEFLPRRDLLNCMKVCTFWMKLIEEEHTLAKGLASKNFPLEVLEKYTDRIHLPYTQLLMMLECTTACRESFSQRFDDAMSTEFGAYKYQNGTQYAGEWSQGQRSGKGVFFYNSGHIYVGEWFQNQRHGFGLLFFPDDSFLECTWRYDERDRGTTSYFFRSQESEHPFFPLHDHKLVYENELLLEGMGSGIPLPYQQLALMRTKYGRYEGNLLSQKRHGWGSFEWEQNKLFYSGQWQVNNIEGYGLCWYPDRSLYCGNWFDGKTDGTGCLFQPVSKRCKCGVWKEGKLIEEVAKDWDDSFYHMFSQAEILYSGLIQYTRSSFALD